MVILFFGLLLVMAFLGLIVTDLDKRRRQLVDMLDRLEPLVDRSRRLHVRNMRGSNSSLFYANNLLDQLEHEVAMLERQKGCPAPTDNARFSLRPGRRFLDVENRITALEALSHAAHQDTAAAADLALDPPADMPHDSG